MRWGSLALPQNVWLFLTLFMFWKATMLFLLWRTPWPCSVFLPFSTSPNNFPLLSPDKLGELRHPLVVNNSQNPRVYLQFSQRTIADRKRNEGQRILSSLTCLRPGLSAFYSCCLDYILILIPMEGKVWETRHRPLFQQIACLSYRTWRFLTWGLWDEFHIVPWCSDM